MCDKKQRKKITIVEYKNIASRWLCATGWEVYQPECGDLFGLERSVNVVAEQGPLLWAISVHIELSLEGFIDVVTAAAQHHTHYTSVAVPIKAPYYTEKAFGLLSSYGVGTILLPKDGDLDNIRERCRPRLARRIQPFVKRALRSLVPTHAPAIDRECRQVDHVGRCLVDYIKRNVPGTSTVTGAALHLDRHIKSLGVTKSLLREWIDKGVFEDIGRKGGYIHYVP